jgi:hypothetical protein
MLHDRCTYVLRQGRFSLIAPIEFGLLVLLRHHGARHRENEESDQSRAHRFSLTVTGTLLVEPSPCTKVNTRNVETTPSEKRCVCKLFMHP